jgi:hypothetical protein
MQPGMPMLQTKAAHSLLAFLLEADPGLLVEHDGLAKYAGLMPPGMPMGQPAAPNMGQPPAMSPPQLQAPMPPMPQAPPPQAPPH